MLICTPRYLKASFCWRHLMLSFLILTLAPCTAYLFAARTVFLMLILRPVFLTSSQRVLTINWRLWISLEIMVISSINKNRFTYLQNLVGNLYPNLQFRILWVRHSMNMLNRSGESMSPCLDPRLICTGAVRPAPVMISL
jgi:hypothetical protein